MPRSGPSSIHSPRALQLLRRLRNAFHWLLPVGDPVAIASELADVGEPAVIRDLLPVAVRASGPAREAILEAIARLAAPLLLRDFPRLDAIARLYTSEYVGGDAWAALYAREVADLPMQSEAQLVFVGLCGSHRGGFVREAAVQRLAQHEGGAELPFLLPRVNDWVPQIRTRALTAVMNRCTAAYAPAFVALLPELERLSRQRRANHHDLVRAIERTLLDEPGRAALSQGLQSADQRVRRRCIELLVSQEGAAAPEVIRRATTDRDAAVRFRAFRSLLEPATREAAAAVIAAAARDTYAPVRRLVLAWWIAHETVAEEGIRPFLLDRAPGLRGDAIAWWQRHRGSPAGIYREALGNPGMVPAGALLGLGETGAAEDAPLLEPFLRHRRTRMRRAAIRALCRLRPGAYRAELTDALLDGPASIGNEALRCLGRAARDLDMASLWSRAAEPGAKLRLLHLFRRLDKWQSLAWLLEAMVDPDTAVRREARGAINLWLRDVNRSWADLDSGQRARIATALARASAGLDRKTVATIEFSIRA
jgi:HEAT repeat protein